MRVCKWINLPKAFISRQTRKPHLQSNKEKIILAITSRKDCSNTSFMKETNCPKIGTCNILCHITVKLYAQLMLKHISFLTIYQSTGVFFKLSFEELYGVLALKLRNQSQRDENLRYNHTKLAHLSFV